MDIKNGMNFFLFLWNEVLSMLQTTVITKMLSEKKNYQTWWTKDLEVLKNITPQQGQLVILYYF